MNFNVLVMSVWLLFIAYWISSAIQTKKTRIRKNGMFGGWMPRISVLVIFIILWAVPSFSKEIMPEIEWLHVIGFIVLIFGAAIAIWARRTLGANWSSNLEIKQEHELITSGPYHLVRHPIYTGVITGLLGTFLVYGRLNSLILLIMISIGMIIRAKIEDDLMRKQFPDLYPEYQRKVRSLIPFVF